MKSIGGRKMMANVSVANSLCSILMDEELEYKKEMLFRECQGSQLVLLWKILYETEIGDTETLKARIYEFGSNVKEQDYLGREVFLFLVAFLNLVIK